MIQTVLQGKDSSDCFIALFVVEGRLTHHKFVHHTAQGPHIDAFIVGGFGEDFWGGVVKGAHILLGEGVGGAAEIAELVIPVLRIRCRCTWVMKIF